VQKISQIVKMKKITFTCEIVSPMFSGSAYKNTLEFRPTELKASLRFWWRAMHPNLSLDEMRKKEFKIFGSGNDITNKSHVRIIDFEIQLNNNRINDIYYDNVTNNRNNRSNNNDNIVIIKKAKLPHKRGREQGKSLAFVSGTFSITFGLINEQIFSSNQLIALMKIASYLGGLGTRSRRGMGAWRIIQIDDNPINEYVNLQNIYDNIALFSGQTYTINHNKIFVSNKIERSYPYIREIYLGSNGETNVDNLTYKIINTAHKIKGQDSDNYKNCAGNSRPRLASPIYISIIKNNNQYFPVITFLNKEKSGCQGIYNKFKALLQ